jgi:Domain of unknown function (DUF5658)
MQTNPQHRLSATDVREIYDRRLVPDRRAHPTTFWSALRWRGRRMRCRRAGEGRHAYVDCPAPHTVILVFMVVCCSVLDAWLTLCHLADGGREVNPVMAFALAVGPSAFLSVKMGLSILCAWFLAAHQQFTLAMQGLYGLTFGYTILLLYHGLIRIW